MRMLNDLANMTSEEKTKRLDLFGVEKIKLKGDKLPFFQYGKGTL